MDHNPDRICVWPGYFDAKTSRRNGRRVPRDSSVLKPDLEGLFYAARKIGLKKSSVKKMFPTPIVRMARRSFVGFSLRRKGLNRCEQKEELLQMIGGHGGKCKKTPRKMRLNVSLRDQKPVIAEVARSARDAVNKVLSNVNARVSKAFWLQEALITTALRVASQRYLQRFHSVFPPVDYTVFQSSVQVYLHHMMPFHLRGLSSR